jgi:hypothetical protein
MENGSASIRDGVPLKLSTRKKFPNRAWLKIMDPAIIPFMPGRDAGKGFAWLK